jgi:hypothetical protein
MKSFLVYVAALAAAVFFISCSRNPSDVLQDIRKQQINGNYDNLNAYYTKGTIKAMEEFEKLSLKNKTGKSKEDKRFMDGTDWDIVAEKINGSDADVVIKYTDHPIENMRGLELMFKLQKEDGKWKLDMENDIRKSLEMLKNSGQAVKGGKANYFKKNRQDLKSGGVEQD